MNTLPLDQLTLETFAPQLQTKFRVHLNAVTIVELELAEANGINSSAPVKPTVPFQESFSLIFSGPKNGLLPQNIYSFEHEVLGRFDLFIVPVGQAAGSIQYQAVFNRLIKPG